jgi:hypothetical protein
MCGEELPVRDACRVRVDLGPHQALTPRLDFEDV